MEFSSVQKISLFWLIFLFNIFIIGSVYAENHLEYHKNSIPEFTLDNEPLIYSVNGSYSFDVIKQNLNISNSQKKLFSIYGYWNDPLNDTIPLPFIPTKHTNENTFSKISDGNVIFGYSINGINYDEQENDGGTCFNLIFHDETPYAPEFHCYSAMFITWDSGAVQNFLMNLQYPTQTEKDEYLNIPSIEGNILVNYKNLNPNITKISPIILNLGQWPVRIDNNSIYNFIDKPIRKDTIIIKGTDKSMILTLGGNSIGGVSRTPNEMMIGDTLYTISTITPGSNNSGFYYLLSKKGENYNLRLEKDVEPNENGTVGLYFRPVRVDYSLKIEDPIIEHLSDSTLDSNHLRYKPILKINSSDTTIQQIKVTYRGKDIPLEGSNGSFSLDSNEYFDASGNSFNFPFDQYSTDLKVTPSLMIEDQQKILEDSPEYDGSVSIENDKITIILSRPIESFWAAFFGLVIAISTFVVYLFSMKDDSKIIIAFFCIGEIASIFLLIINNRFSHLRSVGTILILVPMIIILIVALIIKSRENNVK